MVAPIPPYEWPSGPIPNVTPFTYRDGLTYLDRFEGLIRYINLVVIPYINEHTAELVEDVTEQLNLMIETVNNALAAQDAEIDTKISELEAEVASIVSGINADYSEINELVTTGRLSEAELSATFAARQAPPIYGVPLYTRGTSYTLGSGATGGVGYSDLLAQALGATVLHNGGLGGTQAVSLCYEYIDDDEKWTPGTSTGVVVIESGVGETLNETASVYAQQRYNFESAITTAIRWHRASAARKANHASIVLGSGASLDTIDWLPALALAPGIKLESVESFTITVQAGVHEIVLLSAPWKVTSDATRNWDYTVTVNGVTRKASTRAKGDARPDGSNVDITLASERITDLTPGDTIVVTKITGGTEVWFWGYLEMANPNPPAICLMLDVYMNESSGQWVGSAITGGPMVNNKTLDVYRDIMRRVAASAEFADGTVIVADPAPYFDPTVDLAADGLHPDDSGHLKYARAALTALQRISG